VNDTGIRVRGALGNAVVWGSAWAVGSIVLLTLSVLFGLVPAIPPGAALLQISARFGLTGFAVGTGFSGFLAYAYRDERLSSIRALPFMLGGAVVSAVVAPMAGASALIGSVLGALTAGATLSIAKRAERHALGEGGSDLFLES
jgi:hypothetical protein